MNNCYSHISGRFTQYNESQMLTMISNTIQYMKFCLYVISYYKLEQKIQSRSSQRGKIGEKEGNLEEKRAKEGKKREKERGRG